MDHLVKVFSSILLMILLAGCLPQAATQDLSTSLPSTAGEAQEALVEFLTLLSSGGYEAAVPLYGGEYEHLQVFNPEIEPDDHAALWAWVCDHRLLQCLAVRSTEFVRQQGSTFIFLVEFNNADGSLFVRGPCCGADETEMPPQTQFEYRVMQTEGKFLVLDTPPYVP
jgi:hypothetical protein